MQDRLGCRLLDWTGQRTGGAAARQIYPASRVLGPGPSQVMRRLRARTRSGGGRIEAREGRSPPRTRPRGQGCGPSRAVESPRRTGAFLFVNRGNSL